MAQPAQAGCKADLLTYKISMLLVAPAGAEQADWLIPFGRQVCKATQELDLA